MKKLQYTIPNFKKKKNYWRCDKLINTHTLTKRKKGGMAYGKDSDV